MLATSGRKERNQIYTTHIVLRRGMSGRSVTSWLDSLLTSNSPRIKKEEINH